ncbi:hypothetical protein [Carboxylicivirga linearis]|uniref:Uncharacterized protein n=1 Tax=Carboxylicivirga linearis TaxID=1628157 RepID=A0ABS5JRG5_9BACT|nr:hypothetical protein [Carboxylicivirga linearis]MBS2097495.1 hypothetical protein [Carboxylicivirga linearis]
MGTLELNLLGDIRLLFPIILISIISVYYLIKSRVLDSLLLSIGSLISLLLLVYQIFIYPDNQQSSYFFEIFISIERLLGILHVISAITFITGFLILILKQINKKEPSIEDAVDNIK